MSQVSRRSFLKVTAFAGGGLVLGCVVPVAKSEAASNSSDGKAFAMSVFVQVATDGVVTITAPRPDCGQGVRTSLAMIIAEEMGVDWKSVKVVQAQGNRDLYGRQGVAGSGSVSGSYGALRKVGATAALMLRQAAAKKWGVDVATCVVQDGQIVSGDKKAKIGDFAAAAAEMTVPQGVEVQLKDPKEFKIIGKPLKRVDNLDVVTGKAGFGIDTRVLGMKFAVIARPPNFGGGVASFDDTETKKVPGVSAVFLTDSGVAVVADSTWTAIKGRDALKVVWNASSDYSSAKLAKDFTEAVGAFPEMPAGSAKVLEAVYSLPFLAHAPMEPMNCTAHVKSDSCEIWVPTQVPDSAQDSVARQLSLPKTAVTVNVTLVGGGFGRRLSIDYVTEAVKISKQIAGPVQLLWTRDDDMMHDNYRPATHHAMKGAVDATGMPTAFYHQLLEAGGRGGGGENWGQSRLAYSVANTGVQNSGVECPVPTGAWRSVENTFLNLVNECFFDELCAAGGKDPVELRLQLVRNEKLKATLKAAAETAGWGKELPKGWGRGVACFSGYGSHITQIAEVEARDDGSFKIHRVVAVVDCGLAVNPLGIEAQIQGATMDGISTLIYSAITIKNGGAEQAGWSQFGWGRNSDAPVLELVILPGGNDPGGIGEVGFPASGPAVLNAIFAATGKRLRNLPIGMSLA